MYSADRFEEALMKAYQPDSEELFSSVTLLFPDGSSASSNPAEGAMTQAAAMTLRLATQQCREHALVANSYADFKRLPEIFRGSCSNGGASAPTTRVLSIPPTTLVTDVWRCVLEFLDVNVLPMVPWWGRCFFVGRNELMWGMLYSRYCGGDIVSDVSPDTDYRADLIRMYRAMGRGAPLLSSYVTGLEFGTVFIGAKKYSVVGGVGYPLKLRTFGPKLSWGPSGRLAQFEFVSDGILITMITFHCITNQFTGLSISHKAVEPVKIAVSVMLKVCV